MGNRTESYNSYNDIRSSNSSADSYNSERKNPAVFAAGENIKYQILLK